MHRLPWLLLTALALAPGCDAPPPAAADPTVRRDSAGAEHVAYAAMPALAARTVGDEGVAVGPGEEFGIIIAASYLPDGRAVVTDVSNYRFGIFSDSGTLVRWLGREGSGPLEFRNLAWARPFGDSIMAFDRALRRLTVTDTAGKHGRALTLLSPAEGLAPEALTVLGDGGVLVRTTAVVMASVEPGIHRPEQRLWRYAPEGTPLGTVGPPLQAQEWVKLADPQVLMPRPFGGEALVATAPERIYLVDSGMAAVAALTGEGRLLRRTQLPIEPEPIGARPARYREQQVNAARQSDRPGGVITAERLVDAIPFPERVPAFRRALVDADGRLWLQRYPGTDESDARFLVLSPDGRLVDQVMFPVGTVLFDAKGDEALVRRTGPDGAHQMWRVPLSAAVPLSP